MLEANARTKGNPEWGYKLNFAPNPSEVSHEFCGPNDIIGALCPNCNKPLLRLLSLDAKDRVLNLDVTRSRVVHLLYCWTCIPFGEFSYQIKSDGRVQILVGGARRWPREVHSATTPHRLFYDENLSENLRILKRAADDAAVPQALN